MEENNIFTYATSELSQDAILFYMLNFANDDSKKGQFAREFLKIFECDKINESNYSEFEIYSYKQFKKIDVLLLFVNKRNKNDSFLLIIEDKVNSEESKENQLTSYVNELRKKIKYIPVEDINSKKIYNRDEILTDIQIVPVYFKTGIMTTEEENNLNVNKIIRLENIYDIIKKYKDVDDFIINQWIEKTIKIRNLYKNLQEHVHNCFKNDNNTTVQDLYELCYSSGQLDVKKVIIIMNEIGKHIFSENKVGKYHKFYKNNDTYNYNTENSGARGNPEIKLGIKQDFLYKELVDDEYHKINPEHQLVYSTFLCMKNFDLQVIFEILVLNKEDYTYANYASQSFLKKYGTIEEKYNEEKNKLYRIIEKKVEEIKEMDENFKDIFLDKISNRSNLKLASFNWKAVNKMKIKDFKNFVLELVKLLEEVAENFGFEKQW